MATTYSWALTEHGACIVQIHLGGGRTAQHIAGEDHDSPLHSATPLNTETLWIHTQCTVVFCQLKSGGPLSSVWPSGVMVRVLNLRLGRSCVRSLAVPLSGNNPGQVVHTCASVTKQYNLVLVKGLWCPAAGKVTVGLASHLPCINLDFSSMGYVSVVWDNGIRHTLPYFQVCIKIPDFQILWQSIWCIFNLS